MNPSNFSSIAFPFLGLEMNPPRAFCLGPLTIHLYGVIIAAGSLYFAGSLRSLLKLPWRE